MLQQRCLGLRVPCFGTHISRPEFPAFPVVPFSESSWSQNILRLKSIIRFLYFEPLITPLRTYPKVLLALIAYSAEKTKTNITTLSNHL